jgi:hypothetical protein
MEQWKWILQADRIEVEIIHVAARTCTPKRKIDKGETGIGEISKQVSRYQTLSRETVYGHSFSVN